MISKKMRMTICYLLMGIMLLVSLASCGKTKDEEDMRGITDKVEDATLDIATADVATEMEATPMDAELQETSTASDADAEQEPEKNGKIIVLDPGHSNIVTGNMEPLGPGSSEMKAADATGTHGTTSGLTEIELDFQIATKLKTELEDRGYTVILTRYDNDTAISCSERAIIANDAGADALSEFMRMDLIHPRPVEQWEYASLSPIHI
jgi:N-acetylmuramoyl-L-alanine amidase